jgi:SAM-dependent methyltransferase
MTKGRNLIFIESDGEGDQRDLIVRDLGSSDEKPPYPPRHLMTYGESIDQHKASGRSDSETLKRILAEAGFNPHQCKSFIELGCANCRVLRWFYDWSEWAEGWGADINSNPILWAVQSFPRFNFVVTTTTPHVPFPDNYHDLVFCFSVFTHIDDLCLSWFSEIWRVLKPGGLFYFTILDEASLDVLKTEPHRYASKLLLPSPYLKGYEVGRIGMLSVQRGRRTLVIYKRSWLLAQLRKRFEVVSITERTMAQSQTAILVRKPRLTLAERETFSHI